MTGDRQTLAVYDERAQEYAGKLRRSETDPDLLRFMGCLKPGDLVLDLGCGPGAASAEMLARGFRVDPVDASRAMVDLANREHSVGARQATFDDLDAEEAYAGVWANFSLLHAPRSALPAHVAAIFKALKPGGFFHLGMKTGEGEARDRLGRFYTYYAEQDLRALMEDAGFCVLDATIGEGAGLAGDVSPWVTILARKPL